jgi:hypothetical protein
MSIERRLRRLEEYVTPQETPNMTEKRRKEIREAAEHANRCQDQREPLPFEITESGDVLCARDGRPVTTYRQTLAEVWYWEEVEDGAPGLVHDEEAQAFYTQSGELALSRDRVDLQRLMGKDRDEAWEGEG